MIVPFLLKEKRKEKKKERNEGKKEGICVYSLDYMYLIPPITLQSDGGGNLNIYYIQSYIYIYIYVFKRTCNSLVIELITEWKRKNKINM